MYKNEQKRKRFDFLWYVRGGQSHPTKVILSYHSLNSCFTWSVSQDVVLVFFFVSISISISFSLFIRVLFAVCLCSLYYHWRGKKREKRKSILWRKKICVLNMPLFLIMCSVILTELFMHNRFLHSVHNSGRFSVAQINERKEQKRERARKNGQQHVSIGILVVFRFSSLFHSETKCKAQTSSKATLYMRSIKNCIK